MKRFYLLLIIFSTIFIVQGYAQNIKISQVKGLQNALDAKLAQAAFADSLARIDSTLRAKVDTSDGLSLSYTADEIDSLLALVGTTATFATTPELFGADNTDATDDLTFIQDAIDYASSHSIKNVQFAQGTYYISGRIVMDSYVNLIGEGTIKAMDGYTATSMLFIQNDSCITIQGLTFDRRDTVQVYHNEIIEVEDTSKHITFKDLTFKNAGWNDIRTEAIMNFDSVNNYFDYTGNMLIDNCTSIGNKYISFYVAGLTNSKIVNCNIHYYQTGIEIEGGINSGLQIMNNYFYASDSATFSIESSRFNNNQTISGNIMFGNGVGISGSWNKTTFENNKMFPPTDGRITKTEGTSREGFEVIGNDNMILNNFVGGGFITVNQGTANAITGTVTSYDTAWGHNNIIRGNIVHNHVVNAIGITMSSSLSTMDSISNIIIEGNIIDLTESASPYAGVYLSSNAKHHNIKISNNIIVDESGQWYGGGIYINSYQYSNSIDISNNTVNGFANGVYIKDSVYAEIVIRNNDLRKTSNPISDNSTGGVIRDIDNIKSDNAFESIEDQRLTGSNAFNSTDVADTVLNTGGTASSLYFVNKTGTVATSENLTVRALVDTFIVYRDAGTTSGLTYNWWMSSRDSLSALFAINGNFSQGSGDNFDGWNKQATGTSTITQDLTGGVGGSRCVKLTVDAGNSTCGIYRNPLTAGKSYKITFYAKVDDASGNNELQVVTGGGSNEMDFSLTTSFVKYTYYLIGADNSEINFTRKTAASKSIWIDDITIQRMLP